VRAKQTSVQHDGHSAANAYTESFDGKLRAECLHEK
jgi:hypothetical protein